MTEHTPDDEASKKRPIAKPPPVTAPREVPFAVSSAAAAAREMVADLRRKRTGDKQLLLRETDAPAKSPAPFRMMPISVRRKMVALMNKATEGLPIVPGGASHRPPKTAEDPRMQPAPLLQADDGADTDALPNRDSSSEMGEAHREGAS